MEELTLHVKLVAKAVDIGGYINYVFENLKFKSFEDQFVMCVQFHNWNQSTIEIGDTGYVSLRYVKEGVSQWFDGTSMQVYKYTNIIFLKFIPEVQQANETFIVD